MGDKTSFPLLCITNYLAFKYAFKDVKRDIPVKINGDDIVFRATRAEIDHWFEVVKSAGLQVHKGKTGIDEGFFNLNSTTFHAGRTRVTMVPIIRSAPWYRPCVGMNKLSVGDRLDAAFSFKGKQKFTCQVRFLRDNVRHLRMSGVSMLRGHHSSVPPQVLKSANLHERERTYLSLPDQIDRLPAQSITGLPPSLVSVPLTKSTRRLVKRDKKQVAMEFVKEAWRDEDGSDDPVPQGCIQLARPPVVPEAVAKRWVPPIGGDPNNKAFRVDDMRWRKMFARAVRKTTGLILRSTLEKKYKKDRKRSKQEIFGPGFIIPGSLEKGMEDPNSINSVDPNVGGSASGENDRGNASVGRTTPARMVKLGEKCQDEKLVEFDEYHRGRNILERMSLGKTFPPIPSYVSTYHSKVCFGDILSMIPVNKDSGEPAQA